MLKNTESPRSKRHNRSQLEQDQRSPLSSHTVHHHNKLKVFIKFKPETTASKNEQVTFLNQHEIEVKTALKHRVYKFDHVFSPRSGPKQLFETGCKELIQYVFRETYEESQSNNGLVFVYGNTGTGKTYSMGLLDLIDGPSNGLVPDALKYIFSLLQRKSFQKYTISISFCEIYMDEVFDLLALENEVKLAIREDVKTKEPFVQNQMIIQVQSAEQAFQIINIGLQKRKVAEQMKNKRSSRGHGVILINIDPNNGQRQGRLCFVDLAGCERLKESESKGTTLSEALHINSSLSSLQTLLMNISEQTIRNYRASKLTRMLQPYLERGRIHLFATTTRESASTIQFAKRCKGIRFMERDLRQSVTPIKRSMVGERAQGKCSKELLELIEQKRVSQQREKKYMECISELVHILGHISKELENCLHNQKLKTKFSFSDIMDNSELEDRINRKIEAYQKKQQTIIEDLLAKLGVLDKPETRFNGKTSFQFENLSELTKNCQNYTHEISQQFKGLAALNDYRAVYKKEFFTSELKLHLLEQRCINFQQNIQQLVPYMNTGDKRVLRRLKDLGVSLESSQNQPHLRNKPILKREKQKQTIKRAPLFERPNMQETSQAEEASSSSRNRSTRRSPIFIDQI